MCASTGVYDKPREALEESLEAAAAAAGTPPPVQQQLMSVCHAEEEAAQCEAGLWDYKLSEQGEEHGPFTTAEMAAWAEQVLNS